MRDWDYAVNNKYDKRRIHIRAERWSAIHPSIFCQSPSLSIYVCMHVCMYLSFNLCMYISIFQCMYVCMYVCVYVYMYVCIYLSRHISIHSLIQLNVLFLPRDAPHLSGSSVGRKTSWSTFPPWGRVRVRDIERQCERERHSKREREWMRETQCEREKDRKSVV